MIENILKYLETLNLDFREVMLLLIAVFGFMVIWKGSKYLLDSISKQLLKKEQMIFEELKKQETQKKQEFIEKKIQQEAEFKSLVQHAISMNEDYYKSNEQWYKDLYNKIDNIENNLLLNTKKEEK